MRKGERTIMVAADSQPGWRVIVGGFFRRELIEGARRQQLGRFQRSAEQRSAGPGRHAVQEIAPRDFAVHSQLAVSSLFRILRRVHAPFTGLQRLQYTLAARSFHIFSKVSRFAFRLITVSLLVSAAGHSWKSKSRRRAKKKLAALKPSATVCSPSPSRCWCWN